MSGKDLAALTNFKSRNSSQQQFYLLPEIRAHWYWFVVSFILCTTISLLYLRYATPRYTVTGSLLIRDESRGGDLGDGTVLEELGVSSFKNSIDNEVEILKSRSLMEGVVDDLQLQVRYFATGRVKAAELYDKSPFHLRFLKAPTSSDPATYNLTLTDQCCYQLSMQDQHFRGRFGETIKLPHGLAILTKTRFKPAKDDTYSILISSREETFRKYAEALSVSVTNKLASLVDLSIHDNLPAKGEAILRTLLANYLRLSILDKNRIADSTIAFLDKNLLEVTAELAGIEKGIALFRKNHKVVNLTETGRLLLQSADRYAQEENGQLVRFKVLTELQNNLLKDERFIVPSSLFQQAPGFAEIAAKFNEVQLLRRKALLTISEPHPRIAEFESQIEMLRQSLLEGIGDQMFELQISIAALRRYNDSIQIEIAKIPILEKTQLDFTRQQQLKQDLYLFLLKKKVETAISKSSAIAAGRIIDPPKANPKPTNPSHQLVLLMSGLISIGIPLGLLHLKNILDDRITGKTEIEENCRAPIFAEISYEKMPLGKRLDLNARGMLAEQFRALRTNIQFLNANKDCQTILITSSSGGEGKSFLAINLSHSLALAGKKVILAELDLRKPTIGNILRLRKVGFRELLTSAANLDAVIQPSPGELFFDVITSGLPPPNPVEMLALPKLEEIVSTLRGRYDYIIFDTPPIGLVTDARLLSRFSDLSLYVVRQHFTFKSHLNDINRIFEDDQFPALRIILNGVKPNARYQYDYGYGIENRSFFDKLLNKLKF
ncbi:GumC family protein [Dyadobacter luticola]|uniref:non-specific protein-tyrosine kinase n=1 Tax=Dyadobacter luticola TaxID=1979387 RepID=A0A5R9KPH4_9BACT|nr:tyrosine-protein kinase [Dyadobacter luticola]TLU98201.1 polysaccharide biosynthesis tyrosine autokinase [Dyadobacter luticola]